MAAPAPAPPEGPLPWPGDAELVSFLPLVWVAWSDGHLSELELDRIRAHLAERCDLSAGGLEVVESWLRPDRPPSPEALAELRARIRSVADRIPASERRSLARLGAALARAQGEEGARWSTEGGMRLLEGFEELLGVLGGESARVLLDGETPPAPDRTGDAEEEDTGAEPVDVHRLRRILDGPRAQLRGQVFALLAEPPLAPPADAAPGFEPTDAHRERVLQALRRLAEEGYGRMAHPEACGGGADVEGSILVFETLAYGDLSVLVKFGVQFGLFGGSILQLGTGKHHERWLPAIGSVELPGCYAMTEVDHGSNVRDLETTATFLPEADAFEIHTPHAGARKDWIGNAALHGRMATVFARLLVEGEDHGVHAFLVPLRSDDGAVLPGVDIEDCGMKVGLNGVDNGRIAFDRVRVPRDHLLDRFGRVTAEGRYESPIPSAGRRFFTMLGTLVTGRISIAAASVSASKSALTVAIRHGDRRRQFGPSAAPEVPVLDYLEQQRLLLPRLAASYALHFGIRDLVGRYAGSEGADEDRARIEVAAAGLKAYASRHAVDTIQAAREACGGRGYLAANRLGALRADTDIFTTFEGANVVLLQLVARGLLSRYREEMGDLNLRGMVRYLAERAGTEAQRRNPVRSRRRSGSHVRDPDMHAEAFRFREERLLLTVARRLKALVDDGVDSFEAMNHCQDHLVRLALAHVETDLLGSFHAAVQAAPEAGGVREELGRLATLWALSRLEADRAWFLESGYMEGSQTKAIRAQVNALCRELRPSAVSLVDAFGIPDAVLRAPEGVEV
jgi:acyl-CoA oxidase